MTQPPTTSLPAASHERDALLATKLHMPRLRPGLVRRPRLLASLTEGMARELVLVCTPAGFGKTTLLADWARADRRPVAWLSLDAADNDPARFWRHVAAALDGALPGVAERAAALLGGLQSASSEAVVTTLVNQLVGGPEVVLVLDDYHLIQAPRVHQSVGFLLTHLPPCLRLVLATRADPPLPLARLRAGGQLTEFRAADLRFTPEEAAQLLRMAVGSSLPEAAVAALGDRTEGWVAGLQLAALSLRGRADIAAFVEGFSGSHRYVLDYLAEEVLDRQPEQLREFLLETAVLERMSAPLCDAATGHTDSQALLERVERANLFLIPLDEERRWWRYHHLFADLLRARLQRERPKQAPGLHRAAAAWYGQHGLADDAIRHALAAGDAAWAASLIEAHVEDVLVRSEAATLERWLGTLPAELVRARPQLCLAKTIMALEGGRVEEAEPLLGDAERAFASSAESGEQPVGQAPGRLANLPAMLALLRADLARLHGDAGRAAVSARQAQTYSGGRAGPLGSIANWHLAVADWLEGRLGEAEQALTELVVEQRAAGEGYMAMRGYYDLGQVQQARGRLAAALETYQQGLEAAALPGRPTPPAAGIAYVGMAEVLRERDDLDAALHHAINGVTLCRQLAYSQSLATGLAGLAWIRQALGDRAGARDAIREAGQVQPSPTVVCLFNPVPTLRARLALANGEVADVARWVQARGLDVEDPASHVREREHLVLARVLLATDAPDGALRLLERLHPLAVAQARTASVIEVQALRALACAAIGDERCGLTALAEALALAAPEGYIRVFVDEGASMAALLDRLLTAGQARVDAAGAIPPNYLARLAEAFDRIGLPAVLRAARGAPLPGLVVPLTSRELEVLRLLAVGKPNRAIAGELVITLDTVKRHVTHILDKLGAANRTQAVTRARKLGLLQ